MSDILIRFSLIVSAYTVQFPYFGGFNIEYADNNLYTCKKVADEGWSFAPEAIRTVPKNR